MTRINYKTNENVRVIRSYIIDCMVEEDLRDYDNDFIMDCGNNHFSKRTVRTTYIEDILEGYRELTKDFQDDFEYFDDIAEDYNFEKYYRYEIA